MIKPPFEYALSEKELQKLGELSLTWAHTEQLIGHCVRRLLRLNGEEAAIVVFPLSLEQRLRRLKELAALNPVSEHGKLVLAELLAIMPAIQLVRNHVVHSILTSNSEDGSLFYLSSKDRTLTKDQILKSEELTNYACHVALAFRLALGDLDVPGWRKPLPDKPAIPDFLRHLFPTRKK